MAINKVGNDGTFNVCDFQNDLKGVENNPANEAAAKQAADTAAAQSTVQANTQSSSPLRGRKTFGSQNLKAQIDSRLQSGKSASRSVREPSINNLLRSAGKLTDVTSRYRARTEDRMGAIRNDAKQFIDDAHGYSQRLEQGQTKMQTSPDLSQLVQTIGSLVQQIQSVIAVVRGNTNDLIGDTYRNLDEMTQGAATFEKSAQTIASGNASVLKNAVKAFDTVNSIPPKIDTQVKAYADTMQSTVEPLAKNAQSAAATLGASSDVDSFSLKDVAHQLADKAYKFVYDVKEKVGDINSEYIQPILKAVGTGLSNLWNSIFNPDRNPNGKAVKAEQLVTNTQDLRNTIAAAKAGDQTAVTKLKQKYGYTLDTLPKPGQLLIASNYAAGDLNNGLVTAQKFPGGASTSLAKPADATPPTVQKLLFGQGTSLAKPAMNNPIIVKDANGKDVTVKSMTEYEAVVAANRQKLGIPPNGGKPTAVHLSLEGGGGKGKRFAPAFEEMYNLGVVPASVSGVSVGAIAGALVAAGLPPQQAKDVSQDPRAKKFFDATIAGPGILEGRELYRYMDEKLRALTGIKDRPVTFADLPIPLYLGAYKFADTQAPNDMNTPDERRLIFSKETTPNTPVAMAVVASAAIPGAFDQVRFVDPITGRIIDAVDGGVGDTLPINYQRMLNPNNKLPELAIQLNEPNQNNPLAAENNKKVQTLPAGNLGTNNPIGNATLGLDLQAKGADSALSFKERNSPGQGVFVLNVPTWNLQDFSKQDSTFEFEYNNSIDPALDVQTAAVTRQFFQQFLTKLEDPKASGTNLNTLTTTGFTNTFTANGNNWTATRAAGSDIVSFRSTTGKTHTLNLGKDRLDDWAYDNATFKDLGFRLRDVIVDHEKYLSKLGLN